jgi:hypothetical protein
MGVIEVVLAFILKSLVFVSAYSAGKIGLSGVSWLWLKPAKKNIEAHIELLKQKPSSRKLTRDRELKFRLKLSKAITPLILIPVIGELIFLTVTIGRFSNRNKITKVYAKALQQIDKDNLKDAVNKMGQENTKVYNKVNKEAGYLSVLGHSEIARQSILTLNSLLIDANIAGINMRNEQSIQLAIYDTAELVSSLVREEQTGIHSNIDTYLNVVDSIKKDMAGKKSVFMEAISVNSDVNQKN